MNKVLKKFLAATAFVAACFTLVAFGQVVRPLPVPAYWSASNGDYFGVSSAAKPILRIGTNSYTGFGTNYIFWNGTNGLVVNNGLVTSLQ